MYATSPTIVFGIMLVFLISYVLDFFAAEAVSLSPNKFLVFQATSNSLRVKTRYNAD